MHVLPQAWRDANLLPLLKKNGVPSRAGSYRPISITSILVRRVEKIIQPQLLALLPPSVLSRWQAGFRRQHNTRQQILQLHNHVVQALHRHPSGNHLEAPTPYPVAFIDIERAFDSVDPELMLVKLWRVGVRGELLQFFRAFLTARRFRIMSHAEFGEWIDILAGLPQGSVLGPLLYILFINDCSPDNLPGVAFETESGCLLFADDGMIAPGRFPFTIEARHAQLQRSLNTLGAWARLWRVRFSASKSGCIWFRPPNRLVHDKARAHAKLVERAENLRFVIPYTSTQQVVLPIVDRYQYLGFWFDQTLSPDAQVSHMLDKCGSMSELLSSIQTQAGSPSFRTIRQLVLSTLLPRMTYGLPFIAPTERQYARLNALLFRPFQRALALPIHVHRAGLAVYTGVPVVEVQREQALATLVASTFCLAQDESTAADFKRHPVLWTVARHCTSTKIRVSFEKYRQALRSDKAAHKTLALPPLSLFSQFALHANRWNLLADLPTEDDMQNEPAAAQQWATHTPILKRIKRNAAAVMRYRWLHEARGARWLYRDLRSGLISQVASSAPRGVRLLPLFGVSERDIESVANVPRVAADTMDCVLDAHMPAPSLLWDEPGHAKLRTRIVLNRASFYEVYLQHDKRRDDPLALLLARVPQSCRHIDCSMQAPLVTESAHHVLVDCPMHAAARMRLLAQLRDVIAALRLKVAAVSAAPADTAFATVMDDAPRGALLYHLVCASPLLMRHLTHTHHRLLLLRSTGEYLEDIASFRPL